MNRRAAFAIPTIMLAACSMPPESTDFAIPMPDGALAIEYTAVPVGERTQHLLLERELVLSGAFDTAFYEPRAIAIAANGEIFVLDHGNHRVVVFDRDGNALRQFGRSGQGPGELQEPDAIGVAGNKVVVYQLRQRRISVFSVEGAHVEDHVLEERLWVGDVVGLEEDLVLVSPTRTPLPIRQGVKPAPVPWVVGVYAADGSERGRIVETQDVARARYLTQTVTGLLPVAVPHPLAALAPDGSVYATAGDEYQILAIDRTGSARFVLRVGMEAGSITEALKDDVTAQVLERLPGESFLEITWPERFAAIVNLETDGKGNLYVFSYALDAYFEADLERQPPAGPVPVDVYLPDGEQVFAGSIDIPAWDAQRDDRVCRIEPDPGSGEEVVACYRLVLPGEEDRSGGPR